MGTMNYSITWNNFFQLLFIPIGFVFYQAYTIHGVIAVLLSVVAHELGHYIALKKTELTVQKLSFGFLSLDFTTKEDTLTFKQELAVSGSGPVAGVLSLLILIPYLSIFLNPLLVSLLTLIILFIHITNLLPIKGYDGYYIKNAL